MLNTKSPEREVYIFKVTLRNKNDAVWSTLRYLCQSELIDKPRKVCFDRFYVDTCKPKRHFSFYAPVKTKIPV